MRPSKPKHLFHHLLRRPFCSSSPTPLSQLAAAIRPLGPQLSALAAALLAAPPDSPPDPILDSHSAAALLRRSPSAPLALLCRLHSRPSLALSVFTWRRALPDPPLLPQEFSKAIALAGRARSPDLAASLFSSAAAHLHDTGLYNSLMSAYMYNGLSKKCLFVFQDLQRHPNCKPTLVTYNILLSLFARTLLVDHMESVLSAMSRAEVDPDLTTYNTIIAAYVTAWMWDRMEATYEVMEGGPVFPDENTHLLMLRGYCHAENIEKMERMYAMVKERVDAREAPLIRAMICAYCKSDVPERVIKVERLLKCLPNDEYRSWLNVLLIRLYAQEGMVEAMDRLIAEAFERGTTVLTVGVMRSIGHAYFNSNAVDQFARFVKQAEGAGWRLCRSLYHCKMVMYGKENRLEEMHGVLNEMEACNLNRSKKTFIIMYKIYSELGRRHEVETIVALMYKHGFLYLEDAMRFLSLD